MDFIDDFIEEYKNNSCLWKADSVDFRNRSRRQEAYMRLIAVATRHGELYNVERTKQKINNLRCAFRHQLRKYNEVKKKGEKYEPYCPKRRYFESLMFLKDEEIPEKKPSSKQTDILPLQPNTDNNAVVQQQEAYEEFSDAESLPKQIKNDNIKLSPSTTSANEFCANLFEEVEVDPIISIQTVNSGSSNSTTKEVDANLPTDNNNSSGGSNISDRRKSVNTSSNTNTNANANANATNDKMNSTENSVDSIREKQLASRQKCIKLTRKRSLSGSSQLSDSEAPSGKCRAGISNIDFERLFQLAFKNADNQLDDHFTNFGKIIAHKLRSMDNAQAIYAEKIIADVLYQGQMKMLSTLSITQFLSVDNTTVYVESHPK